MDACLIAKLGIAETLGDTIKDLFEKVADDLTSRGALAGAASVIVIVCVVGAWALWTRRVRKRIDKVPTVILVTGSRGKSSVVRLLHAVFRANDQAAYAKMTGTAAAEITTSGLEHDTFRWGQVSVLEMFNTMSRAGREEPHAVVMECMAVTPGLIDMVANRVLQPNITVITNVELDHLEEEGSTLGEIAESLALAIRPNSLVVTGETAAEPLNVIQRVAQQQSATCIVARVDSIDSDIRSKLSAVHPQNIAIVLAIAQHLGISQSIAVTGMQRGSREPGENELWERKLAGMNATYVDLGAINDPRSLLRTLQTFHWPMDASTPRIALLVGRWDRPLRALEFAGCLDPQAFDGVVIIGGPVHRVRTELLGNGWPRDRVNTAVYFARSPRGLGRRIRRLARNSRPDVNDVMIVGLENEHDSGADTIRRYFHRGEQRETAQAW